MRRSQQAVKITAGVLLVAGVAWAAWIGLNRPKTLRQEKTIQFHDATGETGIAFRHADGSSGRKYIVETITAGLALFDYDGDGDIDIYFLNGAPLKGETIAPAPRNALFRNDGQWRFTEVTNQAGLGDAGFGLGVAVADYDNDGNADLFVNNYGPNVLYHNNGDGTFSEITQESGVLGGNLVGGGANFLDIDSDGDLDLYVANYVDFTYDKHVVQSQGGFPVYAGPRDFHPQSDFLYRNDGDGRFTDISAKSGVQQHAGAGMGTIVCDYDGDHDADIFVMNDVAANFLFRNNGFGEFEEVGASSGVAYNGNGDALGSMGVDCGDYNNDGRLDFFMTSYQNELPVLYENQGGGFFEDVTRLTNAGANQVQQVGWGTGLVDFDNDGDLDIFVACGHLQDNIALYDSHSAYRARNILLMNDGDGDFVDISNRGGEGMLVEASSRGTAFDDLDNDGRIDVVILNSRERPTILRNTSLAAANWIEIRLVGIRSNRDGVGAQVRVVSSDLIQTAEVCSGRGYQSHFGTRLHFGLGDRQQIDRIEVFWIGGEQTVLENISANKRITIFEQTP